MGRLLVSKKSAFNYLKATFFLLLFLPLTFASAHVPTAADTCPEPSPSVTSINGNDISFGWSAVSGAVGYNVKYTTGGYTSGVRFVTGTSIDFSDLPGGTYKFHFQTVCGVESSDWIATDDLILF